MPEAGEPTYRQERHGDGTYYKCLWCNHDATDYALFAQHMMQRHNEVMPPLPPSDAVPEQGTAALPHASQDATPEEGERAES